MKAPAHLCWLIVTVAVALCTAATLGCGEEATERTLCASVSRKICEKWFNCWPVVSATFWGNQEDCRIVMQANCANSEALYACDLDNLDLMNCDDEIEDSVCGSLPASCTDMVECYY